MAFAQALATRTHAARETQLYEVHEWVAATVASARERSLHAADLGCCSVTVPLVVEHRLLAFGEDCASPCKPVRDQVTAALLQEGFQSVEFADAVKHANHTSWDLNVGWSPWLPSEGACDEPKASQANTTGDNDSEVLKTGLDQLSWRLAAAVATGMAFSKLCNQGEIEESVDERTVERMTSKCRHGISGVWQMRSACRAFRRGQGQAGRWLSH